MGKVEIELNSAGIRDLLKSEGIRTELKAQGDKVVGRCGDGYTDSVFDMPSRSVCRVSAASKAAKIDNADNNTLLTALFGG